MLVNVLKRFYQTISSIIGFYLSVKHVHFNMFNTCPTGFFYNYNMKGIIQYINTNFHQEQVALCLPYRFRLFVRITRIATAIEKLHLGLFKAISTRPRII